MSPSFAPPYKKPPLIEAVIAVHFVTPLEQKEMDAFQRKSKKDFLIAEELVSVGTSYNVVTKQQSSGVKKIGYKLLNPNRALVVMIQSNQMSVIQQSPYTGWEDLYEEARKQWDALSKIIRHNTVSRASTRYINRIDIPVAAGENLDLSKYFNIGLSLPHIAQEMGLRSFYINCSLKNETSEYLSVLNVAAAPSPLIDHLSFTIDIDVVTTGSVPPSVDKMWDLVGTLRKHKNDLFEACITPDTRKLFQ